MRSQIKKSQQLLFSFINIANTLKNHIISKLVHSYFEIMIQSTDRITTQPLSQCLKLLIHIIEKINYSTNKYLKYMILFAESFTKHNCVLSY